MNVKTKIEKETKLKTTDKIYCLQRSGFTYEIVNVNCGIDVQISKQEYLNIEQNGKAFAQDVYEFHGGGSKSKNKLDNNNEQMTDKEKELDQKERELKLREKQIQKDEERNQIERNRDDWKTLKCLGFFLSGKGLINC